MKKLIVTFFILVFFVGNSFSQQENVKELIEQKIEELTESSENEYDYSDLYDLLFNLYQNPINLNSATKEDLLQLPFLNDLLVESILEHRQKYGQFISNYELKDIEGFNLHLIYNILPFIEIKPINGRDILNLKNALKYGRNELFVREIRTLEVQKGFEEISDSLLQQNPNAAYLGDANHLYVKYRYQYRNRIDIGFTADKDAGEELFGTSNPSGFDFYSFHAFGQNFGHLKKMAIGDYHLEFGQGLTLWSGLGFGKSSSSIVAKKRGRGLRPNSSANENLFLRGAAATFELVDNIELTAFYSKKGLDGNLEMIDTLNREDYIFTSLQETGYHRTPSELENKNAVIVELMGGHIQYANNGFMIGTTAFQTTYDKDFVKTLSPYQYFDFQGNKNYNLGTDFNYANSKINLFGELAVSKNMGKALVAGALCNLTPKMLVSLLYRNFSKEYYSIYSTTFSEGGKSQNEKGLYVGSEIYIGKKNSLTIYYDIFRFPWLKYRVDAPSEGDEFSLQFQRTENRNLQFNLKFKSQIKEINSSSTTSNTNYLIHYTKKNMRFWMNYAANSNLKMKTCIEYSLYDLEENSTQNGFVMYQDFKYKFKSKPFDLSFRYAIFNTDGYDSRIYAYEDNVLYAFSVPGYYYKGQRTYLLLNYEINRRMDFWLRYAVTIYDNKTIISSGLSEIQGNHKSEISAQLRIKF